MLNAEDNGLSSKFEAFLPEVEAERKASYRVVVANILAGTLIELAPLLSSRVEPGGTLIMSGIWGEEQTAKVLAAFDGKFTFSPPVYQNGWSLVQGVCNS